jgi:5,10-methylene-tetrahydrofolate dehydrogenase/methenyl tetrahydrofolate cyclohydrolase
MHIVDELNSHSHTHAILVQLPLPAHINENDVVDRIDHRKDVDGLTSVNAAALFGARSLEDALHIASIPCTALACMEILKMHGVQISGQHAVVVGRSRIVGKPLSSLLTLCDATVTLVHSKSRDVAQLVRQADILIAACGNPKMVRGSWLKKGATVIDVGINRVESPDSSVSNVVGDVHFDECRNVASLITLVPGMHLCL